MFIFYIMITDNDILNIFIKDGKLIASRLSKAYIIKHKEILDYLLNRYSNNYTINDISEIIYRIVNNINSIPNCICGNQLKYVGFYCGYQKHCSSKCAARDPIVKEKLVKTNLEKYGVEHSSQLKEYNDKMLQTKLEKYGKYVNTEKIKQVNLERHGVEWPAQLHSTIEKMKQTKLERYGDPTFSNPEKMKQTKLERYGDPAFSNPEKTKQTKLEKYGNPTFTNPEKMKQTKLERYGEHAFSNSEKMKQTKLERYGDENYVNSKKAKQTCINRYGVDAYAKTEEGRKKLSISIKSKEVQDKRNRSMKLHKSYKISKIEQQFKEYLEQNYSNDFEYQYRSEMYPFNCDFYIKSLDLYIEIQGTWQHNNHPFNENNQNDVNKLNIWNERNNEFINKGKNKNLYQNAIYVWSELDPKKRKIAQDNNLNYLEIFSNNINDAIQIFEEYINNLNN